MWIPQNNEISCTCEAWFFDVWGVGIVRMWFVGGCCESSVSTKGRGALWTAERQVAYEELHTVDLSLSLLVFCSKRRKAWRAAVPKLHVYVENKQTNKQTNVSGIKWSNRNFYSYYILLYIVCYIL